MMTTFGGAIRATLIALFICVCVGGASAQGQNGWTVTQTLGDYARVMEIEKQIAAGQMKSTPELESAIATAKANYLHSQAAVATPVGVTVVAPAYNNPVPYSYVTNSPLGQAVASTVVEQTAASLRNSAAVASARAAASAQAIAATNAADTAIAIGKINENAAVQAADAAQLAARRAQDQASLNAERLRDQAALDMARARDTQIAASAAANERVAAVRTTAEITREQMQVDAMKAAQDDAQRARLVAAQRAVEDQARHAQEMIAVETADEHRRHAAIVAEEAHLAAEHERLQIAENARAAQDAEERRQEQWRMHAAFEQQSMDTFNKLRESLAEQARARLVAQTRFETKAEEHEKELENERRMLAAEQQAHELISERAASRGLVAPPSAAFVDDAAFGFAPRRYGFGGYPYHLHRARRFVPFARRHYFSATPIVRTVVPVTHATVRIVNHAGEVIGRVAV